jgi:mono/diheme cytochrome c family protein
MTAASWDFRSKGWMLAVAPWLLLCFPLPAGAQNQSPVLPARSVWDSVYTTDQAQRGETSFKRVCAECHTPGQFSGTKFIAAWGGAPLYQFFDLIRTTMPNDLPGSLPAQTYADILAYILRLNRYPAGQRELVADPDSLRTIRIEPPRSP